MTIVYSAYIVLVRLVTAVVLLPCALGMLVLALWSLVQTQLRSEPVVSTVTAVACAASTLALVGLWLQSALPTAQTLVRTGVYPLLCARMPTSEAALIREVARIMERTGEPPVIVGSGWSFFLNRMAPVAREVIYVSNLKLRIGEFEWGAGATVAQVCADLRRQNLTLASRPTLDDTTLGAWICANGHGNASTFSGGTNSTFQQIRILDMRSNNVLTLSAKGTKALFDGVARDKYCVLSCTLAPVHDGVVKMKGTKIEDAASAAEWLSPISQLRVLFVGAARSYGLAVVWNPSSELELQRSQHVNPHFASRVCFYIQVDICSVVGGWHESLRKYDGHSRLSDANRWSYWAFPLGIGLAQLAIVASGLQNFEIFFVKTNLSGEYMWALTKAFIDLHKAHGGRTELRVATEGVLSVVHVDVSIRLSKSRLVFSLLSSLGVERAALHRGKRVEGVDAGPVTLAPIGLLFEDV